MKNFLLGVLFVGLISATTYETLSSRSKEQVILHGDNITILTNTMKSYYKLGFRVVEMESQSVSTSVNSRTIEGRYRDVKGEVIVVMEK